MARDRLADRCVTPLMADDAHSAGDSETPKPNQQQEAKRRVKARKEFSWRNRAQLQCKPLDDSEACPEVPPVQPEAGRLWIPLIRLAVLVVWFSGGEHGDEKI